MSTQPRPLSEILDHSEDPPLPVAEPLDQYRRLIESLTDYAIFSLSEDGCITSWNSGATLTFGYDSGEVLGRHYSLIFTEEDIANRRPELELFAAVAAGKASCDGWHIRKDKSRLWCTDTVQPLLDESGTVTGFTKIVRDSTENYVANELLRQSEERLHLLIEGVTDYAIFSIDPLGNILLWNSGAEKLFGYPAAEVIGKHFGLLYTDEALILDIPTIELAKAASDGSATDESWHVRRGGERFFASGHLKRLEPDVDGKPRGFVKIAHDITERMRLDEAMKQRAFSDELTQLANRASFGDHLRRTIAHAKRHPEGRFAVIFLDLDRFKIINDSLGHEAGDRLLVHVARVLERCVRPDDIVARFGGDEFTILLPNLHHEAEAIRVAERIHAALSHPVTLGDAEIVTTASMGIAIGLRAYETAEQVLRDADTAMYEAKERGRARHVLFDHELHASALRLLNFQTELRQALKAEQFTIGYQPIVSLERGNVCGFEALVRWDHPVHGTLGPSDFLAEADSMGLIVDIDRWVLEHACRQLRTWQTQGDAGDLTMSVNISRKLFAHEHLIDDIRTALDRSDLSPRCLKLGIAESALMADVEIAAANVTLLAELGVALSIDDFGSGYSSLSHLTHFPLETLRVDRLFVESISSVPRIGEIAKTIVTLAHNMGIEAVAEGIETSEQAAKLRAIGCAFGQGSWFSPAVDPEVAQSLIGCSLPSGGR